MNPEQMRKWFYADIDELIDMEYDETEKGGESDA